MLFNQLPNSRKERIIIGCKGKYTEWITDDGLLRIHGWAREGLTDEQISHNMGISRFTLQEWRKRFPAISATLKAGKAPVDIEVENALLKRAMGYQYEETITEVEEVPSGKYDEEGKPIMKQVKHIKKVQKTALPDTTAQIFWLKNRRPDKWREKTIEPEKETSSVNIIWGAKPNVDV